MCFMRVCVFNLPSRPSNKLTHSDHDKVSEAADRAMKDASPDLLTLLEEQVPDALRFLTTNEGVTTTRRLWALRRFEICSLELARRQAVASLLYTGTEAKPGGFSQRLSPEVRAAMESGVDASLNPSDWAHINLVRTGLRQLGNRERQTRESLKRAASTHLKGQKPKYRQRPQGNQGRKTKAPTAA